MFNSEKVEKTIEAVTLAVSLQGYAFGQVKPRLERDETTNTMNIVYVIDEGPRVYIERINIVGNFRTQDGVSFGLPRATPLTACWSRRPAKG